MMTLEKQEKIRECAIALEEKLLEYSKDDPSVTSLHEQLKDLIERAKQLQITQPVKSVPASYAFSFNETPLAARYPDLKKSYSDFRFEIKHEDTNSILELMHEIKQQIAEKK